MAEHFCNTLTTLLFYVAFWRDRLHHFDSLVFISSFYLISGCYGTQHIIDFDRGEWVSQSSICLFHIEPAWKSSIISSTMGIYACVCVRFVCSILFIYLFIFEIFVQFFQKANLKLLP